jgi:hypothetical protein
MFRMALAKSKRPRTLPIYGDMVEWLEWQRERSKGNHVFSWKQPAKRVEAKEKALGSHLKGWAPRGGWRHQANTGTGRVSPRIRILHPAGLGSKRSAIRRG